MNRIFAWKNILSSTLLLASLATSISCTSLQERITENRINKQLANALQGSRITQRNGAYSIWDGSFWRGYYADGTSNGSITSIKINGILKHSIIYEQAEFSFSYHQTP